ncbi:hypothetical protein BST81_01385 [Leptolyngbya sp. 'hensonii']|uniref:YkvA family protein n=1 Tax=Leptolyngbya sp. 'hensonii' TaxID=1922337 RepID=UPI00094F9003|nr:YkvA family protein [Leptolyngbya sp. 'hensonii']OLP20408.1 hypothetical protein BST81_01385 [Leptolyngbya sp. 'hensonii']
MNFSIQSVYTWYRNTLRNPKYRWWIIGGTLVYLLSPFDIAPDFLPILGQIDDLAIVTLLVAEVSSLLMDTYKTRRKEAPQTTPTAEGAGDAESNGTVDVDAISM